MAEVLEDVVVELEKHDETMRLDDFVRMIERHHDTAEFGVSRALLAEYADTVYFDVDPGAIDQRATDSDEWLADAEFYEMAGSEGEPRVSVYPPDWHETVSDLDDTKRVIEVIQRETTESEGDTREAVTEQGVPERKVIRVAEAVANIDPDRTQRRLKDLRKEGEIEEFASQHRNPTIRLN